MNDKESLFVPDWDFDRVCSNLKRKSFDSKMAYAHHASANYMSSHLDIKKLALAPEIETFVMLSIKYGEWDSAELSSKEFSRCITGIRNYCHPKLFSKGDEFAKWFMLVASATQFDVQADPLFRMSRYYEYFTFRSPDLDMNDIFKNKFGLEYITIAAPIFFLWFSLHEEYSRFLKDEKVSQIIETNKAALKLLTLTREQYVKELDEITVDIHDYAYCLRPSYTWPFVEYDGKVYNPTPHLLLRAVSTSLMYRLTDGRNDLRERIGRQVLEPYLFKVVAESGAFSEIIPEQEYKPGQKTLDIMASVGNDIICFDSKSFSPSIGIRVFSEEAVANARERIAKSVVQVYRHIHERFGRDYAYLSVKVQEDQSNIFGIVVLVENPYLDLEEIYEAAAIALKLSSPSPEYDWLRGHIGIVDIDTLEEQLFKRENLQEAIRKNLDSGRYSDNWFASGERKKGSCYPDFVLENCKKILGDVITCLNLDNPKTQLEE